MTDTPSFASPTYPDSSRTSPHPRPASSPATGPKLQSNIRTRNRTCTHRPHSVTPEPSQGFEVNPGGHDLD